MSETLTLDRLPSDILTAIALCSDRNSVLAFGATCRMFYDLVKNSVAVQLYLELAAQGLFLNPSLRRSCSSAEWYNRLIRAKNNWMNLDFANLQPFKLSLEDNEMLSVVQGGVFACGASTPGHSDGVSRIKVVKLASSESGSGSQASPSLSYASTTVSAGRYLSAFRTSAEQDLLILGALTSVGPSLSIHTLSGAQHPLAKKAILLFRATNFIGFAVDDPQPIQIQGDHVSVLLTSGGNSVDWGLVIWNWKTGTHVFCKHYVARALSFTFLSPSSFMVAERDAASTHLIIEDFNGETGTSVLRFKLKLPELSMGWHYGHLHFKNDLPSSACDSYQYMQAALPDPEAGVIYLSVGLSGPHLTPDRGPMPHLGLFIGREALRQKVLGFGPSTCEPLVLEWSQWGETVTRWVDVGQMPGLLPAVHSSRYIQLVRQPHSPNGWLQVLDFSRSAVYDGQHNLNEPGHSGPVAIHEVSTSYGRLSHILAKPDDALAGNVLVEVFGHDRPTVLDMPGAFLHPVASRLPYLCVTRPVTVASGSEWTIDGNILFRVDEPEAEGKCCVVYPYRISDGSEEVKARSS